MKRVVSFFRHDWMRKLFALLFAVIIYWNINDARQKNQVFHNVPVEVTLSPDLYMPGGNTFQVSMTIRGTEERLQKLVFERPSGKIAIDSSMVDDGKCRITLTPENFSCGARNKVISISPAELELNIQRIITRKIPVKARISGQASPGYELLEARCQPSAIEVTGPEKTVNAITDINTEPIQDNLGDSNSNFRVKVVNPLPELLSISQEPVLVTTKVIPMQEARKVFSGVQVLYMSDLRPAKSERWEIAKIDPASVKVTVAGTKAEINKLTAGDVNVYVNIPGTTIDNGISVDLPLQYQITSGIPVKKVTIQPEHVKVSIKKIKLDQK